MPDSEWLIWLVVIVAACLGYWLVGYIFDELSKAKPRSEITAKPADESPSLDSADQERQ